MRRFLGFLVMMLVMGLGGCGGEVDPTVPEPGAVTANADVGITNAACTDSYKWYVSGDPGLGGYAKAEWTANSCGYRLQVRVWCHDPLAQGDPGSWEYSGIVKGVNIWDQAGCSFLLVRGGSYIHFSYDGGSTWTAWQRI